eukprot:CAMPEP_0194273092 /NCGR_PEP_ID=MMETSP0169-20130528/6500_1 /TAXON_ID=218684 /ORGANISM="Corethron pennatum, Strain L29A3" /LENGTH=959 /DNA_ID=CAMNT_0039015937 /DNA_START=106 /DNA_END=2981 /DNA_ORIENTATION=+
MTLLRRPCLLLVPLSTLVMLASFTATLGPSPSTALFISAPQIRRPHDPALSATRRTLAPEQAILRRKSPALWRTLTPPPVVIDDGPAAAVPQRRPLTKPEIMAPAGGIPQLRAAIANGADSVYVGLSSFSARARAANFDPGRELTEAVALAHAHGVRVYVALNTLAFDGELREVERLLRKCEEADVDAVIVQDAAVCALWRGLGGGTPALRMELHASTQQTVTDAHGALAAARGGARRVVLGRELSVGEMDSVASALPPHVEVEAFVHGALCVSYSGQCLSSESWGGRSANRGQCAQACRLPYGLVADGVLSDFIDESYLLSPQDLCGVHHVEAMMRAGVSCLKIEGRLKGPEYVAATAAAYRNAVDDAWEKSCREVGKDPGPRRKVRDVADFELAQIFSRGQDGDHTGLSAGFLNGPAHQMVVRGNSPRHRGIYVGRVSKWTDAGDNVLVIEGKTGDLEQIRRGDGVVCDRGLAQLEEMGGSLFDVGSVEKFGDGSAGRLRVRFGRNDAQKWADADCGRGKGPPLVPTGAIVWRTHSPSVSKKLAKMASAPLPPPAQEGGRVSVTVSGTVGEPFQVHLSMEDRDISGVGASDGLLEAAMGGGWNLKKITKAIGQLGDTPWDLLGDVDLSRLGAEVYFPMGWVKEARRRAVEDLRSQMDECLAATDEGADAWVPALPDHSVAERLMEDSAGITFDLENRRGDEGVFTRLSVLARNLEQVSTLVKMVASGRCIDEIMVDFLEVDGMREAARLVRSLPPSCTTRLVVAAPRIIKPDEEGIWRTLLSLEPDALLVRSPGLVERLLSLGGTGTDIDVGTPDAPHVVRVPPLLGDFSLNVCNTPTAREWLGPDGGLARVTASYDLNARSITDLAEAAGPAAASRMEAVVHAHIPIFHTEHCVFARFLSEGNSYTDCGHVCTRHDVRLRDEKGKDHLVLADMGCRNTVFAGQAQSGVHSLREWAG